MIRPGLSVNCLFSGFHTGKGKGKAVDNPEQDNPCSSPESDKRSRSNEKGQEDEEQQLLRAIQLSLEKENKGESPKTGYTGKGKGRAVDNPEQDNPCSSGGRVI